MKFPQICSNLKSFYNGFPSRALSEKITKVGGLDRHSLVTDLFGIFEKITKMGLAGTPCDRFICVFCTLCLLPDLQKAKQAKMSKGKDLFSHKGILEYLFLLCLS